jgi:hypothetical protein
MEAGVPYDQRVAIDQGYACKSAVPSHLSWNMEMASSGGMFPDARKDACTSCFSGNSSPIFRELNRPYTYSFKLFIDVNEKIN